MIATPNLIVAGHHGLARRLRNSGRFPSVLRVASASELRDLSESGKVRPPAAFMFGPGFSEDLPEVRVTELANGLAVNGFTVLVHAFFAERGDVFDPKVVASTEPMSMSDLLTTLGAAEPDLQPEPPADPWTAPGAVPGRPNPSAAHGAEAAFGAAPAQDPGKRGRIIAVASAKGGVGKTSMTVNLATHAARVLWAAGRAGSTVVVDTNVQQADVARYLDLKSPTILDLLDTPEELSATSVRRYLAHKPEIGLHALLGPPDTVSADPDLLDSTLFRRILTVLRGAFDFVFVDTPVAKPYHPTFTELLLPESDAILVPIAPNRVALETAHAWLTAITRPKPMGGEVSPEKISLILNHTRSDAEYGSAEATRLLPGWQFVGTVPENKRWVKAVNNHQMMELPTSPDLDVTLRGILKAVSDDPVFADPGGMVRTRGSRSFRLLLAGSGRRVIRRVCRP
ncbi:AAA family ATPase [Spirillospora sp. CA-128828]|uniref:AAA family ATPase n=1 Tax=Spirillospora sp. CA-128828 TaxID=3240033 RepID=UPI003D8F3ECC